MELEHSFTVPIPKDRAWDVLLDVEKVAPCMPGATLDSVDGDEIRGRIKVKVGPITMTYAGTARFIERDRDAGVVTLEASGKETRGAGTASASVRSVLADQGSQTHVSVRTTLNVTGKPAQFGRGVMNDVGGKLLSIFATNLAATLAEPDGADAQAAVAPAPSPAGPGPIVPDAAGSVAGTGAGPVANAASETRAALDAPLDELHLPARVTASLHRDGITSLAGLVAKTGEELLAIDGIGPASVDDIKAKLAERDLSLGQPAEAGVIPPGAVPAQPTAAATTTDVPDADAAGAADAAASAVASAEPHRSATQAAAHQFEDDAINLLKVAGLPVLKRALPVLAGLTAALFIAMRRKARRRRSS